MTMRDLISKLDDFLKISGFLAIRAEATAADLGYTKCRSVTNR